MTGESPRIMFLHYWGVGPTEDARAGRSGRRSTRPSTRRPRHEQRRRQRAGRPAGEGPGPSGTCCGYFLYLGTFGFGGPIALAGYMQRDLVEKRGWITKKDYIDGLALAQLAPGPLAAQLAIYLGWAQGAASSAPPLVAAAFILPSFVMVLALSALYVRFGGLPWMQGAFYGIGAAVIAIIARSALKLVQADARHATACSGGCSRSAPSPPRGPSRRSSGCSSACGVGRAGRADALARRGAALAVLFPPGRR